MNLSDFISKNNDKNVHVVGSSGAEGSAILEFLFKNGFKNLSAHDFCNKKDFRTSFMSFHDAYSNSEKEQLFDTISNPAIDHYFKTKYLNNIDQADLVFVPQSWFRYPQNEKLKKLPKSTTLNNITSLYFKLFPGKIIAITGTSGKSTTSKLTYEIFNNSNYKTYFTGNDRENHQVLLEIDKATKKDILIIEISNRHLVLDHKRSPHIGIITNISPNHLDDHKDYNEYINVKKSLLKYQTDSDFAILNYDNEITSGIGTEIKSKPVFFSTKDELNSGAYIKNDNIVIKFSGREYIITNIHDLKIPGNHNVENALSACLAAHLMNINTKTIRESITNFNGLKHRLEFVREKKGVKFYNDSSACNPDGPISAVKSFSGNKILIVGGCRKKSYPKEFENMANNILKENISHIFLIGDLADSVYKIFEQAKISQNKFSTVITKCKSLNEAVSLSYEKSRFGDSVILSPGAESFGMFKDYRDRGEQFKDLVNKL